MDYKMIGAISLAFVIIASLMGYTYIWLNSPGNISNEMFAIGLSSAITLLLFAGVAWKLMEIGRSIGEIDTNVRLGKKPLADGNSPLNLTEHDRQLLKHIKGAETARKYKGKVKAPDTASPYAIQKACFAFARDKLIKELSADEVSVLETIAYQEATDVKSLCLIIGLEMRDIILKERENKRNAAHA